MIEPKNIKKPMAAKKNKTIQIMANNFIQKDFDVLDIDKIQPYFNDLLDRKIDSKDGLVTWMKDRSELEGKIYEEEGWIYINLQRATNSDNLKSKFEKLIKEILPKVKPLSHQLKVKLVESPFVEELDKEQYHIFLRSIKNQVSLFNEDNIALASKISMASSKYGEICGSLTIEMEGQTITMQKAASFLQYLNRDVRKEAWVKSYEKRNDVSEVIDDIYEVLVELRHQSAVNAGFENFRDYSFKRLGRFDYSHEDCYEFHDSIKEVCIPIKKEILEERRAALNVDKLLPWDTSVDPYNRPPLKPFSDSEELISRSIESLGRTNREFGEYVQEMNDRGFLDLESRLNKAPGGFLYPLPESNVPFIFMNATGTARDITVMVHESGHATHSFLMKDLELNDFKEVPSEVAEYASMAMELMTMENWNVFFDTEEALRRAKMDHLEKILSSFPWMALIDRFQHWVYLNPTISKAERTAKWLEMSKEFGTGKVDYTGFETALENRWQQQLHLFEVPFYYIEYAMAQLGAIATWKQYKTDPNTALANYKNALSLGYTKTIGEIYEAAGIEFNFSKPYFKSLIDFVYEEYKSLALVGAN